MAAGQRIADVVALGQRWKGDSQGLRKHPQIRVLSSYYREDIGQSLWPPAANKTRGGGL